MDTAQAIKSIKRGTYLLKYGRRGKPKFCPFRLSTDETLLIWYVGKKEKQLKLSNVSKIIPGQCTAIFQRYPQPEKEYQSFSLIYGDRSLDLICKDKDEAEIWITALRELISLDKGKQSSQTLKGSPSVASCGNSEYKDHEEICQVSPVPPPRNRLGRAFSEVLLLTAAAKAKSQAELVAKPRSRSPSLGLDEVGFSRNSHSSGGISSSHASFHEDFESLGDVLMWGEGLGSGLLGSTEHDLQSSTIRLDAVWPKILDTMLVLDACSIACGSKHAALITKRGKMFTWGDGSGGKLGHGTEADLSRPKAIDILSGSHIESVACGEFHTCAVTHSGDLFAWGDGSHCTGLLGHGSEVSYWIPKRISGLMDGLHVLSVSCGPWHTAFITSQGKLFTFGDGAFGALGHGDRSSTIVPREVESLRGLQTLMVACGLWHTAAVVDEQDSFSGKLFTWGSGDSGQLGQDDEELKLVPSCVTMLDDTKISRVSCGRSITVALTISGKVYTMGSKQYGQLGNPGSSGKLPTLVEGNIKNCHIEEIACGSHHVAVLSSNGEVYTWGKGANGQLGHGDIDERHTPIRIEALHDRQVKHIACGSNFTAAICRQRYVSAADQSICFGCHHHFNFRRTRHNCYNCGLVFCEACSSKKSMKAALAPKKNKPYRVCNECYSKLRRLNVSGPMSQLPNIPTGNMHRHNPESAELENLRAHRQHARFSSFDSFKQAIQQYSQFDYKAEASKQVVSPTQNGSSPLESIFESGNLKKSSVSLPSSKRGSRAASPLSWKSSSINSPGTGGSSLDDLANAEPMLDDLKQANARLSQEMKLLKGQVENLTQKTRILEAKLKNKSRQLEEATQMLKQEVEENKAAKEVISSLMVQISLKKVDCP